MKEFFFPFKNLKVIMFGDSLMNGNISGTVIRESFYFYLKFPNGFMKHCVYFGM